MTKVHFNDDFKRDAVSQFLERGYPVREVSERLGVSAHSLYKCKKRFAPVTEDRGKAQGEDIRRLKRELVRVKDERDILKIAAAYFAEV